MQKTVSTQIGMIFAALFTALGLLLAPQVANAHDVLTDSTPEIDSTVETTPEEIRLQFSGQPLSGEGLTNLIRVTDAQGNQWQDGEAVVEGYDLAIPVCEGLPQGDYTVAYRVVYSDGHTGEESFSFTNADPSAPEEGTPADCGEAASGASEEATNSDNDSQATSNADEPADENTIESIPAWVWTVGGLGVVIVVGIVFFLLRGSRTDQHSDDSAGDENL